MDPLIFILAIPFGILIGLGAEVIGLSAWPLVVPLLLVFGGLPPSYNSLYQRLGLVSLLPALFVMGVNLLGPLVPGPMGIIMPIPLQAVSILGLIIL
ncbi:MAG: hypothetical protein E4H14_02625 [Candidatus Thorarchaeota archaeon]|nr:MAG: hypothetical protein E4H14_02625 [Candidatus Thorarchaeota archaeon]